MCFRLNADGGGSRAAMATEIHRWRKVLELGTPQEQQEAALALIGLRAEQALIKVLAAADDRAVELATAALWECWMNEQGPAARRELEKGMARMKKGQLETALETFSKLVKKYPRWAEAHNKQATVLYFLGNPRLSYKVCEVVVGLKPHHFGAWNGMALCAAQLERWTLALNAARRALTLQPSAKGNLDLIRLAEAKLAQGE